MDEKHSYHVVIDMLEDRLANFLLDDEKKPTIQVATPPEFPGGRAGIHSPEDLFVGAIASCKFTTYCAMAQKLRITLKSLKVDATGHMEKVKGKGFLFTKVNVKLSIGIENEEERPKAKRALELTEKYCIVTNSVRAEVHLEGEIAVK